MCWCSFAGLLKSNCARDYTQKTNKKNFHEFVPDIYCWIENQAILLYVMSTLQKAHFKNTHIIDIKTFVPETPRVNELCVTSIYSYTYTFYWHCPLYILWASRSWSHLSWFFFPFVHLFLSENFGLKYLSCQARQTDADSVLKLLTFFLKLELKFQF